MLSPGRKIRLTSPFIPISLYASPILSFCSDCGREAESQCDSRKAQPAPGQPHLNPADLSVPFNSSEGLGKQPHFSRSNTQEDPRHENQHSCTSALGPRPPHLARVKSTLSRGSQAAPLGCTGIWPLAESSHRSWSHAQEILQQQSHGMKVG